MRNKIYRFFAVLLLPCMLLLNIPAALNAAERDNTVVTHNPLAIAIGGQILPVFAEVEDDSGIDLVRIYFRTAGTTPYFFVPMLNISGDEFSGVLPAPLAVSREMEYLFLVKNKNNHIFRTQTFRVKVKKSETTAQADTNQQPVEVSTETASAPNSVEGFGGVLSIKTAAPTERYGTLAGLYNSSSTSAMPKKFIYGGIITAVEESSSTKTIIIGGVAAAALIGGGTALALAGGGSDSGSTNDPSATTTPSTPVTSITPSETGSGTWTLTFEYSPCFSSGTQQTVFCSNGLVTAVRPSSITVPIPNLISFAGTCNNTLYSGMAGIFQAGSTCDAKTACNSYSDQTLVSKDCRDSSMVFTKDNGNRIERWSRQ
ncbi:hypothetical protein DGMP_19780 [Desulfomarina profundi]|uniref:Uncharacterized protein n=1 Tax=Desulfomarina profundi TaxID=2772557 RepID=A0A8D5FID8_9BACT|nr:hypothetical protein [Desulfomarina profundi]BCL61285.1 hypothetical protein DGMP_19780 [Desulfomarina profundi]